MSHTKGPWLIGVTHVTEGAYTISYGVNRYMDGPEGDVGKFYGSEDDASRIVACVNACSGIPTDDLRKQERESKC